MPLRELRPHFPRLSLSLFAIPPNKLAYIIYTRVKNHISRGHPHFFSSHYTVYKWNRSPQSAGESNFAWPLPTILPMLPMMLGRNRAIRMLLMICAPMKSGSRSFLRPNARKPIPKPVKNVLFPWKIAESKSTGRLKHCWLVPQSHAISVWLSFSGLSLGVVMVFFFLVFLVSLKVASIAGATTLGNCWWVQNVKCDELLFSFLF